MKARPKTATSYNDRYQFIRLPVDKPHSNKLIVIRNIPGFLDFEINFIASLKTRQGYSGDLQMKANELSKKTFGAIEEDTKFKYPDEFYALPDDSEERATLIRKEYRHNEKFEVLDSHDEEIVRLMLLYKLDFRDSSGRYPLRCINFFKRQAFAAANGIVGKLPNPLEVDIQAWELNLLRDRQNFRPTRNC